MLLSLSSFKNSDVWIQENPCESLTELDPKASARQVLRVSIVSTGLASAAFSQYNIPQIKIFLEYGTA